MKLWSRKNRKKLISKLSKITAITILVIGILSSSLKGVSAQPTMSDSKIIGIDLGTTQSVVSYSSNGKTIIIPNEFGNRITPSIVGFNLNEILTGDAAYNQMGKNPKNTIFDVKRFIGRNFDDPTVQRDMKLLPFDIVNKNNKPYFKVDYAGEIHFFSAEQISGLVLKKLKETAESYLGCEITKAVITVPAHFDDTQKQATKDAGTIAGLDVVRIINEPTSAAIAYGIDRENKERNIIIYDLGGGTFDVSLLTLDDGIFEVQSTGGDTHLGGEDFDENVVKYMIKQFKKKYNGIDIASDDKALSKLRRECEKAKRALSSMKQIKIEIENLINGLDFSEMLTRARFEDLNSKLFRKTLEPLKQILKDSKLKKNEIHEIVLVGGSTRIPKIQEMVKAFFNGKELNRGINPDEAVAFGASIQAAMLGDHWCNDAECRDVLVIDASPLSLGIETVGEIMTKIIDRGTPIPVSKSKIFSTNQDNQDSVLIKVFQGERAQTKYNRRLGEFMLSGIPLKPRGIPQIEVKFEIDANGLLQIEAFELSMGDANKKTITIKRDDHNLSEEEIDEIINEFHKFEAKDQEFIKKTNAKTHLESSVFGLKSKLYDKKEEMDTEDYNQLIELCQDIIQWIDDNAQHAEYDDFNEKQQEFDEIVQSIFNQYQEYDDNDDHFDHEDL